MATFEARIRSIWAGHRGRGPARRLASADVQAVRLVLVQGALPGVRRHAAGDPRRVRSSGRSASSAAGRLSGVSCARSRAGPARRRRRSGRGRPRVRSASDATRLSPGRAVTACITSTADHPGARRDRRRDPGARVLDGHAVARSSTPSRCGGQRGTARGRASACVTSSPLTTTSKQPRRGGERLGQRAVRRRDERHRHPARRAARRAARARRAATGCPAATPAATRVLRKSTISSIRQVDAAIAQGLRRTRASGCPPGRGRPARVHTPPCASTSSVSAAIQ